MRLLRNSVLAILLLTGLAFGQGSFSGGTIGGNVLPDTTGRNLGSAQQQWNAFLQNLTIYGVLSMTNLDGLRFADQFAGASVTARLDAAITDCGSSKCVIVIPGTMGAGVPTTTPTNVTFWDMRLPYQSQFWNNSAAATQVIGLNVEQGLNPSADVSASNFGQGTELYTLSANAKNFTGQMNGVYGSFSHFGSGNLNAGYGGAFEAFNPGTSKPTLLVGVNGNAVCGGVAGGFPSQTPANTGNCGTLRGVSGIAKNTSTGTVDVATGVYAGNALNSAGGAITTNYGLFVGDQTVGATNYSIYTGLGQVLFGDNVLASKQVSIGTLAADNSASFWVQPNASLTGTTQYGVRSFPKTSSAATTLGIGVYGRADTAAAAYTQTSNASFYVANPTKGAGSSITTLYGIYIETPTAGGTNYSIFSPNFNVTAGGVLTATGLTIGGTPIFKTGTASNTDVDGELSFSGTTTASYTWANSYTSHPECTVTPQFDPSTNRYWVTYTSTTSFTINFSGAVTGSVGYVCAGRN